MKTLMLAAIRDAFDAAPAWGKEPPPGGPPKALRVTFRRPEDPDHPDAKARYYQPAGETLAALVRRAGCVKAEDARLELWPELALIVVEAHFEAEAR